MSLDASDFIDNLLDEQARFNSAVDDGDIANLVADFQTLSGELIGMVSEAVAATATAPPHKWDDPVTNNTLYGFFSWA
jgi:hypothetical protein